MQHFTVNSKFTRNFSVAICHYNVSTVRSNPDGECFMHATVFVDTKQLASTQVDSLCYEIIGLLPSSRWIVNMDPLLQQVRLAALALNQPETDGATRCAASQFLEHWTASSEAWETYCQWIELSLIHEEVALQLLCLQLLQAKIRREVAYEGNLQNGRLLDRLQHSLQNYLYSPQTNEATLQPTCLCIAALLARRAQLVHVLPTLCHSIRERGSSSSNTLHQLRILSSIPLELQAGVSGLAPSQVTNTLAPYVIPVLEVLLVTIQQSAPDANETRTLLFALAATKNWIVEGCVSLTQLNAVCVNGSSFSWCLVQLLSLAGASYVNDDAIFMYAAQSLEEAILVATDSVTETRSAAVIVLLQAFEPAVGFLSAPLHQCDEDTAVALASLVSSLVTEEIDELITQPCDSLIRLLLGLQTHPVATVRSAIIDCWLTASEVPVSERHERWRAPLFQHVTSTLLQAIEFSDAVDEDDVLDFRRMSSDVFVACYLLLRCDYVQHSTNIICAQQQQLHPAKVEAALFALTATAREVNDLMKSRTGGSSVGKDRQRTADLLLQIVNHLMANNISNDKLVQVGAVKFFGSFAPIWADRCSSDDVLRLLAYLRSTLLHIGNMTREDDDTFAEDTSKAIKLIMVQSSSILMQSSNPSAVLDCCRAMMETVLSTHREECMATVAEGCTRLIVQTKDASNIGPWLVELIRPVLQNSEIALKLLPSNQAFAHNVLSEHAAEALESLGNNLRVLEEVIRFCDEPDENLPSGHPITNIMGTVFPFLERVSQRTSSFEIIFEKMLGIHERLLQSVPSQAALHFQHTVKHVMDVFETNQNPSCMHYLASSVEAFGSTNIDAFRDLLTHITRIVFRVVHQQGPHSSLIQGFFELCQRFIMYCPLALVGCPEFAGIVQCALELVSSAKGERESVRATLNFLTHIFGWRSLRLSKESSQYLNSVSSTLDEQLSRHGALATRCCMTTLLGGSQALWPVCTDCIFAITVTTVSWPVPEDPASSMARQWMEAACSDATGSVKLEVIHTVIDSLLGFARDGTISKPVAKMLLTDFCMVVRGEKRADALAEYCN